eukprot:9467084-Pyramimonas_sp.AAC.1
MQRVPQARGGALGDWLGGLILGVEVGAHDALPDGVHDLTVMHAVLALHADHPVEVLHLSSGRRGVAQKRGSGGGPEGVQRRSRGGLEGV